MKYRYLSILLLVFFADAVSAQLVTDNAFMQGKWLEAAIAPNGAWGNTINPPATYHTHPGAGASYTDPVLGSLASTIMDFSYDYLHDGYVAGVPPGLFPPMYGPFFMPGTPFDGWAMQVNGVRSDAWYTNYGFYNDPGGTLTGTVTGYNHIFNPCLGKSRAEGVWTGTAGPGGGLSISQTTSIDTFASWVVVTVKFKNNSATTMDSLYYWVSGDPDNDETDSSGTFPTDNHICYQDDAIHRVEVNSLPPHTYHPAFSGLCTKDCRAKALIYTDWSSHPAEGAGQTLDQVYYGTATWLGVRYYGLGQSSIDADIAYGLIFRLNNLPAGDSNILSFAWIFTDSSAIDSAFPGPKIASEGIVHDMYDTVLGCTMAGCGIAGNTAAIDIVGGDEKDWSLATWTWAPSTGLSATTGVHSVVNLSSLTGATSFTITGTQDTSFGKCGFQKTMYVYVVPCFSASSNSPGPLSNEICVYDTLHLDAHGDSVGATYYWYGPGGYSSTGQHTVRGGMTMGDTGVYHVVRTLSGINDTTSTHVLLKPQPVINLSSNGPVCSGTTLTLNISPDSVGETFRWTGPNGFTSVFPSPAIGSVPVSYRGLYKLVANWRGCLDSGTINVIVDSTPATPTAGSNSPICSQTEALLLTATDATPGVSYSWSGPAGFGSLLQNPVLPGASTSAQGTYTVTVSLFADGITCSNKATTFVYVDSTPIPPTLGSNSPICTGSPLLLTATGTTGSNYFWSGPNYYTSILQNPTITPATTQATGVYTVYATIGYVIGGLKTCTSGFAYMPVVVDSTPGIPTASSNSPGFPGTSICEGDTLRLTANDTTMGVTWTWTGPNSFFSTLENPTIIPATPVATGAYTVTASLGATCSAATVITVSITPTPPLTATNSGPVCSGIEDTLYLQAVSDPGATFWWTGPYVFRSALQNPTRTPVLTEYNGVYRVTVTINNCTNSVYDTVVVKPTPDPPRVVNVTYCQTHDPKPVQAMGDSILWYHSALVPRGTGSLVAPIPFTDTTGSGWFYASQTLNGCTSYIDSFKVTVKPKPLLIASPDTAICPHDTAILRVSDTESVAYYHWFPKQYLSDTAKPTAIVRPLTNVDYTIVVSNAYGCSDTARIAVNVFPAAVIDMIDFVTLYPGQTYQISPQTNCSYFSWFPPSGLNNAHVSNPVASPEVSTNYIVHAMTSWGCRIVDSISVEVNPESILTLPNAFVPGNGPNNKFKIIKLGVAKLNGFSIFDRWGNKVFETTNIDEGWDGTYNGKPQPEGVYMYQVDAVTSAGQNFVKHGNLTLLK